MTELICTNLLLTLLSKLFASEVGIPLGLDSLGIIYLSFSTQNFIMISNNTQFKTF